MQFHVADYVKSGLAFWFLIYSIIFAFIAAFWCTLEQVGALTNGEKYTHVFDDLVIIFGFVYYIWIGKYLHGYTSSPEQYRRFLTSSCIFADKFILLTTIGGGVNNTNNNKLLEYQREVIEIIETLVFYSYRMYCPNDTEMIKMKQVLTAFEGPYASNNTIYRLMELSKELLRKIVLMENMQILKNADTLQLYKYVETIDTFIVDSDAGEIVVVPTIFENHIWVVFGV